MHSNLSRLSRLATRKKKGTAELFLLSVGSPFVLPNRALTVRRLKERKYYEWCLHHTVALSLIFLSLMVNEIIIGVMILFVHDISDVLLSYGRFFVESKLPRIIKNSATEIFVALSVVFSWIFFRLYVYPTCLISSIYSYIPTPEQEWYFIYW